MNSVTIYTNQVHMYNTAPFSVEVAVPVTTAGLCSNRTQHPPSLLNIYGLPTLYSSYSAEVYRNISLCIYVHQRVWYLQVLWLGLLH